MPELPEVETIARALREGGRSGRPLTGLRIQQAHVYWPRSIQAPSPDAFPTRIAGQVINEIGRRGKFIVMQLSRDALLVHLRMSGDLRVEEAEPRTGKLPLARQHDRVEICFEGGVFLFFEDTRKFGRMWLVPQADEVLEVLGPEPFSPDLDASKFFEHLQKRKRQIKPLLMDQHFLAGMGNIYTDEALHLAGIHPLTLSNQLELSAAGRLLGAIREVLAEGIRQNGASIDWVYRGGSFQNNFRVYQRTGEKCPVCGQTIERILVGQRSTHFCPFCQPLR